MYPFGEEFSLLLLQDDDDLCGTSPIALNLQDDKGAGQLIHRNYDFFG
jgi:hypothetical protein